MERTLIIVVIVVAFFGMCYILSSIQKKKKEEKLNATLSPVAAEENTGNGGCLGRIVGLLGLLVIGAYLFTVAIGTELEVTGTGTDTVKVVNTPTPETLADATSKQIVDVSFAAFDDYVVRNTTFSDGTKAEDTIRVSTTNKDLVNVSIEVVNEYAIRKLTYFDGKEMSVVVDSIKRDTRHLTNWESVK